MASMSTLWEPPGIVTNRVMYAQNGQPTPVTPPGFSSTPVTLCKLRRKPCAADWMWVITLDQINASPFKFGKVPKDPQGAEN